MTRTHREDLPTASREGAGRPIDHRSAFCVAVDTGHLLLGILLARRGAGFEILVHAGVTRRGLNEALRSAAGDSKDSTKEKR